VNKIKTNSILNIPISYKFLGEKKFTFYFKQIEIISFLLLSICNQILRGVRAVRGGRRTEAG